MVGKILWVNVGTTNFPKVPPAMAPTFFSSFSSALRDATGLVLPSAAGGKQLSPCLTLALCRASWALQPLVGGGGVSKLGALFALSCVVPFKGKAAPGSQETPPTSGNRAQTAAPCVAVWRRLLAPRTTRVLGQSGDPSWFNLSARFTRLQHA